MDDIMYTLVKEIARDTLAWKNETFEGKAWPKKGELVLEWMVATMSQAQGGLHPYTLGYLLDDLPGYKETKGFMSGTVSPQEKINIMLLDSTVIEWSNCQFLRVPDHIAAKAPDLEKLEEIYQRQESQKLQTDIK